jgi:type IV pilus assembly protein PilA
MISDTRGFTLIELMIVVSIIVIIAAIAVPNILNARLLSNEADAIGALRTLSSAQMNFQGSASTDNDNDGTGEFGRFVDLVNATPEFIDSSLGSGQKSGYLFTVTLPPNVNDAEIMWEATAFPINKGNTGNRSFYIDESGVLRGTDFGNPRGTPGIPLTRALAVPGAPPVGG